MGRLVGREKAMARGRKAAGGWLRMTSAILGMASAGTLAGAGDPARDTGNRGCAGYPGWTDQLLWWGPVPTRHARV